MAQQDQVPCPLAQQSSDITENILVAFSLSLTTYVNIFTPELMAVQGPLLLAMFHNFEKACTCRSSTCQGNLQFIREQLWSLGCHPPLERLPKFELRGNELGTLLCSIYKRLPKKGHRNQKPEKAVGDKHWYCPICFQKRRDFNEMRVHLRGDHKVDEGVRDNKDKQLNKLFPAKRNTEHLQCFGPFSPNEAEINGFISRGSTGQTGTTLQTTSTTPGNLGTATTDNEHNTDPRLQRQSTEVMYAGFWANLN